MIRSQIEREASMVADALLQEFGPASAAEELEALADELMETPDDYEDGAEAARAVAAELRRRALVKRNKGLSANSP